MIPDLTAIYCPECGEEAAFDFRQLKRNMNLTLTCAKCGLVHLAFNAVSMSMYEHMKAIGRPVGEPPKPHRIEPVIVFPGENGTEAYSAATITARSACTGDESHGRSPLNGCSRSSIPSR